MRFSPPGRPESCEAVLGAEARALEARAALAGIAPGSWPRSEVRIWFASAGLAPEELDALERSREMRIDSRGDLQLLTGPAEGLTDLARTLPGAQRLLAAWENATRPPSSTRVMGVVNATPDSFSDGGRYLDPDRAIEHGLKLIEAGADIVDVGGESTRPGATPVSATVERERVVPVIRALAADGRAAVSVDTSKAEVAASALDAGATVVNDVRAGTTDARLLPLVAERGAALVLMHMQGTPADMQRDPSYRDATREVCGFLRERAAVAWQAGIDPSRIALDPGLGFGKRLEHNLELLRALPELRSLGFPLVVGLSRKSFLGALSGERRAGHREHETSAALALAAHLGAEWHRVHDAGPARAALAVAGGLARGAGAQRDDREEQGS